MRQYPYLRPRRRTDRTNFDTIDALQAMPVALFHDGDNVHVDAGVTVDDYGGVFRYSSADLSSTFVRSTLSILTGEIDAGTDTIDKTAHGLRTGQGVLVTGGDGLTANTVVYYVRGRLPDEFTFHPTYEDAVADTNKVALTGATAFSVKVLVDPDQAALVTLAGAALDGSDGGFIREDVLRHSRWRVEWFPGSGPDDTAQIRRAILAAGDGGSELVFPATTLTFSNRDTELSCIKYQANQTWVGEDRERSVLQLSATEDDVRFCFIGEVGADNFHCRNMRFDGNRDNITPDTVDLYSHFQMFVGADGGKHSSLRHVDFVNCWGRSAQSGYESGTDDSENWTFEDVRVFNAGTKALSLTRTRGGRIIDCYAEVNAYTDAENPGGSAAASGSCFEASYSDDYVITGNVGKQLGATVKGPGIRCVNEGTNGRVFGNSITGASHGLFISSVANCEYFSNTLRDCNIGVAAFDDDVDETLNTVGIRVHHNTVIDPITAYVETAASKVGLEAVLQAFFHDNTFELTDGATPPTYVYYNFGLTAAPSSGSCDIYEWNTNYIGAVPAARYSGAGAGEIMPEPNAGWKIIAQEAGTIYTLTGTTASTTMKSVTIPAYTLGKNGRYRITAHFTFTNATANSKTFFIRHDSVQVLAAAFTANVQERVQVEIANQNSLSSQLISIPGTSYGFGPTNTALLEGTVNTGVDKTISFTGTLADATDTMVLRSYVIEAYFQK